MQYRRFLFYNVAGGVGWVVSTTWAGYLLGQAVPNIDRHIHVLVIIVVILSCLPIAIEILRERRRQQSASS
jgi:membrane-associated protein